MIHPYFAESNLMCNLCTTGINYMNNQNNQGLINLFDEFPALEQYFSRSQVFRQLSDTTNTYTTCQTMNLCPNPHIEQYLMTVNQTTSTHESAINVINNMNLNWKAGVNKKFAGMTKYEIRKLMGTVVDPNWTSPVTVKSYNEPMDLPEYFNVSEQWPECNSVVLRVNDQSNCGNCWAQATTEAFNDRLCITSKGQITTPMSVSDLTGCCYGVACRSFGCNGGQLGTAWKWFMNTGVVSGGFYGEKQYCYSYTMPKCSHHDDLSPLRSCDEVASLQPTCQSYCPDNTSIDYKTDKHKGKSHYKLESVYAIKSDIMKYGSVSAGFTVYEDFLNYKDGVYSHVTGEALGGHGIHVFAWGVENGEEYWLCKNSWGDDWGLGGFFKIKIGDSGINDSVYAGLV